MTMSLMPSLASKVSLQKMSDLIAYIKSFD